MRLAAFVAVLGAALFLGCPKTKPPSSGCVETCEQDESGPYDCRGCGDTQE